MGVEINGLNAGPIQNFNLSINNGEIALVISDQSTNIASLKDELMLKGNPNAFSYVVDGNKVITNQIRISDIAVITEGDVFRYQTLLDSIKFLTTRNSKDCIIHPDGHYNSAIDKEMINKVDNDINNLHQFKCNEEWYKRIMKLKKDTINHYKNKIVPIPYKEYENFEEKFKSLLNHPFFEYYEELLDRKGAQASFVQNLEANIIASILAGKKFFIFDGNLDYNPNIRRRYIPRVIDLFKDLGLTGIYFSDVLDDSAKVFNKVVIMKDNAIARIGKFN